MRAVWGKADEKRREAKEWLMSLTKEQLVSFIFDMTDPEGIIESMELVKHQDQSTGGTS